MWKRGRGKGLLAALVLLSALCAGGAAAAQTATVMVYMIGSDLETEAGCASSDIVEMAEAEFGACLNVLVQTGGSTEWAIEEISGEGCQRYEVRGGELLLQEDLGPMSMMRAQAIGDFIRWGAQNYPANRYAIVFWDHGGGTMLGFGSDELDPDGQLTLGDMREGLRLGGVHMDFVGFDACLMGTLETALAISPYADYLIASEETEPGCGWAYTGWLELLGREPEADTVRVGRMIVDDYLTGCSEYGSEGVTMALIDLSGIDALYQAVRPCMLQAEDGMQGDRREQIVIARSRARTYGEGEYEQVDLEDFIRRAQVEGEQEALDALHRAVVYHDGDVADSCGLAMYHPYAYPEYYQDVSDVMRSIGMDEDYFTYFDDFVSALLGGHGAGAESRPFAQQQGGSSWLSQGSTQQQGGSSWLSQGSTQQAGGGSWLSQGTAQQESGGSWLSQGSADYAGASWYNPQMAAAAAQESGSLSQEELVLTLRDDRYVLTLSQSEWELIAEIYLQVFVDDGECFIDLGMDNTYTFDEDGSLIVDYDYTWVALDGQVVPFTAQEEGEREDGSWYSYGYVKATLNGTRSIELMLCWDERRPMGYVAGYRDARSGVGLPARSLLALKPGDRLDFVCDCYRYDGEYDGEYGFGETLIVGAQQPVVSYEEIGGYTTDVCFYLKDAYQRTYTTETIEFSFE